MRVVREKPTRRDILRLAGRHQREAVRLTICAFGVDKALNSLNYKAQRASRSLRNRVFEVVSRHLIRLDTEEIL